MPFRNVVVNGMVRCSNMYCVSCDNAYVNYVAHVSNQLFYIVPSHADPYHSEVFLGAVVFSINSKALNYSVH